MRSAAWVFILLGFVLAAQWEVPAGAADGARPGVLAHAVGPAVLVAGGATEDATSSNNQVKIVRAPAGLVVAYAATAGGGAQVFLAVSRDGGARWSTLAQVSSGPMPSRLAALALDAGGRLHVIWTRYDDGVGKIYHRIWQGQWTGAQERISPPSGYAGYPSVALERAGRPQVVWYGIREGALPAPTVHQSIYEIYYTGFDGRAWSRPLLLSTGLPDAVNPALAADRAGRLHAVWYQYDGRTYQIRYAERDGAWSAPEGVFRTRSDEFNPDLAADADGRVSLAWEHHDDQRSVIEYTRRASGRWEEPAMLSDGASPARHPSVTTAAGDVYVLWDQDDGQIYLRHRAAGRWEPVVRLTGDGGNTFPSAAGDGAGIDAVWTHTARAGSGVYFVRIARP